MLSYLFHFVPPSASSKLESSPIFPQWHGLLFGFSVFFSFSVQLRSCTSREYSLNRPLVELKADQDRLRTGGRRWLVGGSSRTKGVAMKPTDSVATSIQSKLTGSGTGDSECTTSRRSSDVVTTYNPYPAHQYDGNKNARLEMSYVKGWRQITSACFFTAGY